MIDWEPFNLNNVEPNKGKHYVIALKKSQVIVRFPTAYKGNSKITELRTILQREIQNS